MMEYPDVDRQVREAIQNFQDSMSSLSQTRPLISNSQPVNLIASQEAAAGWRRDGRMSSVRRFFCLYCTFDFLLTSLIWLTCIMLTGASIPEVWKSEVLNYSIHTALVDVAVVAFIRFSILILAYGIIQLNHWCAVAITTSGSCAFFIAKVFLFNWIKTSQPVFEVFFILVSFSLCWSEAWFLDCKVLPSELQAREIMASMIADQPIIRGNQIASDLNSIANYYSPRDSPDNSPLASRKRYPILSIEDEGYRRKADEGVQDAIDLLHATGWKEDKKGPIDGDIVEIINSPKFGKVFRLTSIIECPAEFLFFELSEKGENLAKWNPTVLESKNIRKIDHETGLSYQVSASIGGGAVAARDFVNIRRWTRKGDLYICCGISVDHPDYPPENYIRAENKVGCWVIQPLFRQNANDKVKCRFQWLMCCDLKGWIPKNIFNAAVPSAMLDFLHYLRIYVENMRSENAFEINIVT